ncbi:MAG TPA: family 20 glycosylhydrolase [Gemmatimonadales bacterium]
MGISSWLLGTGALLIQAGHPLDPPPDPQFHVIPQPAAIRRLSGRFTLDQHTRLLAQDSESRRVAELFNDFLRQIYGLTLGAAEADPNDKTIEFTSAGSESLPPEGYRLVVEPNRVRIVGRPAGLFYGMQTLTQLLAPGTRPPLALEAVEITDAPRFGYRGLLLDVARHFYPVEFVKKLLDLMAQYKLNRFHWHLTDDQGWRIEIKRYPRLTQIGAYRKETIKLQFFYPYVGDGVPHGGYYTQEQIREIVDYARARYIIVIPEIEMPGHAQAALASYPELACTPGPFEVSTIWGVHKDVFCPKEVTFRFLEGVLTEVVDLFPGPYVHIGGDEVPKDRWKESPLAQAVIRREGLKNEEELQSYFIRRIEKFLNAKGKRLIGWDETLEGGLAPNAIVMSWRGEAGGIEAARQGHEVVMAPTGYCYLDYVQGDLRREPVNIGARLTMDTVYSYDPIPEELQQSKAKYILGAQGTMWTEYQKTPESVEYMVFPRLLALSEVVWSPPERKDYGDFLRRLPYHLGRLERQRVVFRVPEPQGLKDYYTISADHAVVQLTSMVPGGRIHYTLDGTDPDERSPLYRSPLRVPLAEHQPVTLNVIALTPSGRRSVVYGATLLRRPPKPSLSSAGRKPGLAFALFEGRFATTMDLDAAVPSATGLVDSVDLRQLGRKADYGVVFEGYVDVPADGYYQFGSESDDGSMLYIDDEEVVSNDFEHGRYLLSGHIPLMKGLHRIKVKYFQIEGDAVLRVLWAPSGRQLRALEPSVLFH